MDHATGATLPAMVVALSELDPFRLPEGIRPRRYDVLLRPSLADASFSGSVRIDLRVDDTTDEPSLRDATPPSEAARSTALRDSSPCRTTIVTPATGIAVVASVLTIEFDGVLNDKLRGSTAAPTPTPTGSSR